MLRISIRRISSRKIFAAEMQNWLVQEVIPADPISCNNLSKTYVVKEKKYHNRCFRLLYAYVDTHCLYILDMYCIVTSCSLLGESHTAYSFGMAWKQRKEGYCMSQWEMRWSYHIGRVGFHKLSLRFTLVPLEQHGETGYFLDLALSSWNRLSLCTKIHFYESTSY